MNTYSYTLRAYQVKHNAEQEAEQLPLSLSRRWPFLVYAFGRPRNDSIRLVLASASVCGVRLLYPQINVLHDDGYTRE